MTTERIRMIIAKEMEKQKTRLESEEQSSIGKYYNNSKKSYNFNPKDLWLNKKGCPIGSVPIRQMSEQQLQNIQNLQRAKYNHSYVAPSHTDFAGLIVGNAPSGRFSGGKATMTIWNPKLFGDNQYSSTYLSVEDDDNQIQVGWTVHPSLYADTRTRLYSKWTSDNYRTTGCYINHCSGFVLTSNVVPIDYPFPYMSQSEGLQYDVTLEVVQSSSGDWEFNYRDQTIGTWSRYIFSKMGESASQLRFGGECYEPEGQGVSPQMGSGRMKAAQYDKTAYMRQISYSDSVYGDNVLDDSMVQVHMSICFFVYNEGYNFRDAWYGYSFMFGGKGGQDGGRCVG